MQSLTAAATRVFVDRVPKNSFTHPLVHADCDNQVDQNMMQKTMTRWLIQSVCCGLLACTQVSAHDGLVNSMQLSQAGLQRMWAGQAELDVGRDQMLFSILHVNNSRAVAYFEIYVGADLVRSIATLDLDASGNPLGFEKAQERAELLKEEYERQVAATLLPPDTKRAEFDQIVFGHSAEATQKRQEVLEAAGKTVQVKKYVEPRMTLYTLNSSNVLQAFDAETGIVRWSEQVATRNSPAVGIAANDAMVSVVSGTHVYCLEAERGRLLWSQPCRSVPTAPPAMSQTHVFVPLMNGMLEAFNIAHDGVGSENFISWGQISAAPLVTGRTVSWSTDRGFYNIANLSNIGYVRTRIHTNGSIFSPPAKLGRVLFVTSMDGYVYAIDELLGTMYWEFSAGASISQQALVTKDGLYVVTDDDNLFKLDPRTGEIAAEWPKFAGGVQRLVGASENYIYAIDTRGDLIGLRPETGAYAFSVSIGNALPFMNSQTDRIFLISKDGTVQCLRQLDQIHPQFNIPVSDAVASDGPKAERSTPQQQAPPKPGAEQKSNNPFAPAEELKVDPFQATEPVYDNPFITEAPGDVNPFKVDFATEPNAGGNQPAEPQAPSQPNKPAPADNPFGNG